MFILELILRESYLIDVVKFNLESMRKISTQDK